MRSARQTLLTLVSGWMVIAAAGCDGDGKSAKSRPTSKPADKTAKAAEDDAGPRAIRVFHWKEDLRERLDDLQFYVTQKSGTERAFNNTFWDNKKAGVYVDIVSGEPLFSSLEKFKSGTGWPSYYKPLVGWNVIEKSDASHGMTRVEVRSRFADSHLGHVFKDGPPPTGLRYCINSAALRFIPVKELEAEGYGRFARLFDKDGKASEARSEVLVIAAGCFWCLEAIMDAQPGVITAESGYSGGHKSKPSYKEVCGGKTGHTESVRVTFDPKKTTLAKLLAVFLKSFDATDGRGVKPDFGDQYRPAIFYEGKGQLAAARAALKAEKARLGVSSLSVGLEPLTTFWRAEGYHQDYVKKNPDKRYVKVVSYERMDRVGVKHP